MFLRSFILILILLCASTADVQTQEINTSISWINNNHVCRSEKDIWVLMHALKYDSSIGYKIAFDLYEKTGNCWTEHGPAIKINTLYTGVSLQEGQTGYVEFVVIEYISILKHTPFNVLMYKIHKY